MTNVLSKNGLILAAFALVTTGVVALTERLTHERIAEQQQRQLLRILDQVIDPNSYNNALYKHCLTTNSRQFLGTTKDLHAYVALQNQQPVAVALETIAPDGYNGQIKLIVGIKYDGTVSGVRTLEHQETPGLGDKIELSKANWITGFAGQFLESEKDRRWQVKKDGGDFDQFTGATITPRAVVKAVKNTLLYYKLNREALFSETARCGDDQ